MTPAKDFMGGCQSGRGSLPAMTGSAEVFPEVSNTAKMMQPYEIGKVSEQPKSLVKRGRGPYGHCSKVFFVAFQHRFHPMSRIRDVGHPFHQLFIAFKMMSVMSGVPGGNEGNQCDLG